jgi:hypothetical protein
MEEAVQAARGESRQIPVLVTSSCDGEGRTVPKS